MRFKNVVCILFLFVTLTLTSTGGYTQQSVGVKPLPPESWAFLNINRSFYPYSEEVCAVQVSDGGYITAGNLSIGLAQIISLTKQDHDGRVQWCHTYMTSSPTVVKSIQKVANNIILLARIGSSFLLTLFDWWGNILWSRSTSFAGDPRSISVTSDNGFITCGELWAGNGFLISRFDSAGNNLWTKNYLTQTQPPNIDVLYDICQTSDLSYIATGSIDDGNFSTDIVLMKTDPLGNVQWVKKYGNQNQRDVGHSVISTPNGYAVCGSANDHVFSMEVDRSGNFSGNNWQYTYQLRQGSSEAGITILQTPNGTLVISGITGGQQNSSFINPMLLELTPAGLPLASRVFENGYNGSYHYIGKTISTTDGGFLIPAAFVIASSGMSYQQTFKAGYDLNIRFNGVLSYSSNALRSTTTRTSYAPVNVSVTASDIATQINNTPTNLSPSGVIQLELAH
ncbi:MAG: hypothetical protein HY606_12710 [Planctomycetes bacterium]|nr:hypothetical protein [Planctomycetota bacterium]